MEPSTGQLHIQRTLEGYVSISIGFAVDLTKLRSDGVSGSLFPDDINSWIGRIAITWSQFEMHLADVIRRCYIMTSGDAAEVDKLRSFRKRKTMCRDLSLKLFGPDHPTYKFIDSILVRAADLSIKRNYILHGKVEAQIAMESASDGEPVVTFRVVTTGRHNGKEVTSEFSITDLENLWYEIAGIEWDIQKLIRN